MALELPPADPASPWMRHLERAHVLAHTAARAVEEEVEPSAHLGPAARQLERGVVAMYDAFDGRADRVTSIDLAHARLWDAAILVAHAGIAGALAALQEACGELIAAQERFPRTPLAARAPLPLRAGDQVPPFHTLERASLAPTFRAPPPPEPEDALPPPELPEPTTFAELAAAAAAVREAVAERVAALTKRPERPVKLTAPPEEAPPGFAEVPPPRMTEDDFVRRWARECVEEIGMIGVQRTPLLGDTFRSSLPLERRLVMSMDALAALGPVAVAHVEPLVMDAPAADPMKVFAVAMIGGCLEGRDALACAERVLFRFGAGDPAVSEPFVSALKLAQNPFARTVLRSLLASEERACRLLAAEVLAYRGWLDKAELGALAEQDDARLLALALPALAAARHPALHASLLRALEHADPRVQEAGLDAMALAAHPEAAQAARAAAQGKLGDRALVRLALVADEADARWLLDRLLAAPSLGAVEAAGWAGLADAVPALIRVLESDDDALKPAAGAALDRLLGAGLVDVIEVMPEAIDPAEVPDPDPDGRPPRRSLADIVSDPRDRPPPGSSEKLEVASIDAERWRAQWVEQGRRVDPKHRLRRGQGYSPSVSLYELDRLTLAPDDRRRLHRELAARTGKLTHFDPHDFVVVQEQSLKAWEGLIRSAAEVPGAWGRPAAR